MTSHRSIDVEIPFDKIQHAFMKRKKILKKTPTRIRRNILNLIKGIYEKSKLVSLLMVNTCFSLNIGNNPWMSFLNIFIQHSLKDP